MTLAERIDLLVADPHGRTVTDSEWPELRTHQGEIVCALRRAQVRFALSPRCDGFLILQVYPHQYGGYRDRF